MAIAAPTSNDEFEMEKDQINTITGDATPSMTSTPLTSSDEVDGNGNKFIEVCLKYVINS